jgi:hypothetical protein
MDDRRPGDGALLDMRARPPPSSFTSLTNDPAPPLPFRGVSSSPIADPSTS